LRPLTDYQPKPLIPFVNTPLIEYLLELLRSHGIKELAINLHHLPQEVKRYLGDGGRFGLRIHYSWEPQLLGTAGGIKRMARLLPRDTLVVLNCDILTDIDLTAALEFHWQHKALATLVLHPQKPLTKGVGMDKQYRIHQVAGRPAAGHLRLTQMGFAGIHFIEPRLLDYIPEDKSCCINADIYPRLITQGQPIYGYPLTSGFWRHLGTPQSYLTAHQELLAGEIPLKTKLSQVRPGVWLGNNVSISPQAKVLPPVLVGDDCRLAAQAVLGPYAVLGEECQLAKHSVVKQSILWDRVQVGPGARLIGCVLAKGTIIKESQRLANKLIAS
jgi:mannose-1-phosphate guanylyltransferase/phosphomannomutase